jgi:hypothetical protein
VYDDDDGQDRAAFEHWPRRVWAGRHSPAEPRHHTAPRSRGCRWLLGSRGRLRRSGSGASRWGLWDFLNEVLFFGGGGC